VEVEVTAVAKEAKETSDIAEEIKTESAAKLAKAEPELAAATKSLKELDPKDIAQVKA